MKASHPALPSAVLGIDVLDMEKPPRASAGRRAHARRVSDALCPGKIGKRDSDNDAGPAPKAQIGRPPEGMPNFQTTAIWI